MGKWRDFSQKVNSALTHRNKYLFWGMLLAKVVVERNINGAYTYADNLGQ